MNFFVKLLCTLIPVFVYATDSLDYRIEKIDNDWQIEVTGPSGAKIEMDGIIADDQVIHPFAQEQKLPATFTVNRTPPVQTLEIRACLEDKRCLKPLIIKIPNPTPWYNPLLYSAAIIFNPCFAPLWLIVCTQFSLPLLNSLIMATLLTGLQMLIILMGSQVTRSLYAFGFYEIGSLMFSLILILIITGKNIFGKSLSSRQVSGRIGAILATLLSSGCAIPVQLLAGSQAPSLHAITPLSISVFTLSSFAFLYSLSFMSQKLYQLLMKYTPILIKALALILLLYLSLLSIQSYSSMLISLAFCLYCLLSTHARPRTALFICGAMTVAFYFNAFVINKPLHIEQEALTKALKNPETRLYVTAKWCSECRTLHALLKNNKNILWLDITQLPPWKEKWIEKHHVTTIPSCFKPSNNSWKPCEES